MVRFVAAAFPVVLLLVGAAHAEQEREAYRWAGMGVGSGNCQTYRMSIDVRVDGNAVKGVFRQQGRAERRFEGTKDAKGMFKTSAKVGDGGTMNVSGAIDGDEGRILLDGYCKFEGKLIRKK